MPSPGKPAHSVEVLAGNMSSFLDQTGRGVLRLNADDRAAFIGRYRGGLHEAHGAVQKEHVDAPPALLEAADDLAPWFARSIACVGGLRAKRTPRRRTA